MQPRAVRARRQAGVLAQDQPDGARLIAVGALNCTSYLDHLSGPSVGHCPASLRHKDGEEVVRALTVPPECKELVVNARILAL